jgi:hypothetical protein
MPDNDIGRQWNFLYTFRKVSDRIAKNLNLPDEEAIAAERQIKGWSRKKKEAMMRGDWDEVSRLARSSSSRPSTLRQAQGIRRMLD